MAINHLLIGMILQVHHTLSAEKSWKQTIPVVQALFKLPGIPLHFCWILVRPLGGCSGKGTTSVDFRLFFGVVFLLLIFKIYVEAK